MKLFRYLTLASLFLFLLVQNLYISFANINLTVSPIKYEIDGFTGTTITKTAKLINNTDNSLTISTWKSDFTSSGLSGKPNFVRKSELIFPDQQLSSWISIDISNFVLWPKEEKEVIFTIDIPANATPGWHYWAVFFKQASTWISGWNNIWINIDYWVLVLINVDWEIVSSWEIEDITISNSWWWGWWWWGESNTQIDDCPFWDLSKSNYDNKCIDEIFNDDNNKAENESGLNWTGTTSEDENKDEGNKNDDLNINFEIPFKNTWNTHLKPEGKIKLYDEDWNQLKWIWKQIITNDNWVIIWEDIVDYLPINDIGWNVLPSSKRVFESQWKWFPYKDENNIVKYWNPWEYYTRQNIKDSWFLMFWERVFQRKNRKEITARFDLSYENNTWEDIDLNSARELDNTFYIDYTEDYVWLNMYIVIPGAFLIFIIFIWFIIWVRRKTKCRKCSETIEKKMKICPYCWTKQSQTNKKKK